MKQDLSAAGVRTTFLDFFRSKEHEIVPSSPVVLPSDPTLLFANAGMNQFKEIFLGARESRARRVANSQKCIRVSGKHNDLEEVGRDTYHHTFFEMLGNWSFGDYYKREAIAWAWELLVDVWKLDPGRLWVTVFRDDDEAAALWRETTPLAPDRILRFGEDDNFWEMGETGPCGPCSEIHVDLSDKGLGADQVNVGNPELIELWNLVFIQHNRRADGSLEDLPARHVDTGMGFERLVAVLQGRKSNYDSDVFTPLIQHLEQMSGLACEGEEAVAMRVIADHLRALSFAMADGVAPSNDGRGYVLRRLLRRAVRYGRKLNLRGPFLGELYPVLAEQMGAAFPELIARRADVLRALRAEEDAFAQTLDRGIALFEEMAAGLAQSGRKALPGSDLFKLYDTYGFPVDLTALMAEEKGLTVDQGEFERLMQEQRARARAARADGGAAHAMEQASVLLAAGLRSRFTGYEEESSPARVSALLRDGHPVDALAAGEEGDVVLDQTPFYAEKGGQVGDRGVLRADHLSFEVADTRTPAEGLILHRGILRSGALRVGDRLEAVVDADRRAATKRHHTATHLLHYALRRCAGSGIRQAGSQVDPERLRFDFNHHEALSPETLAEVERVVNECILGDFEVRTSIMPLKDVHGSDIIAVFDEKYGDEVRVLDVGGFSRELCGGTHVRRTGEIGSFRILSESSIASGVRRIEGLCGMPAWEWTHREHELLAALARRFSVAPAELEQRIEALAAENKKLHRTLREQAALVARDKAADLAGQAVDVGGIRLVTADLGEMDMEALRNAQDALLEKIDSGVVLLGSASGGKACFTAAVTRDLVARGLQAGRLIGRVARLAGGGGGGRPDRAQAGGKEGGKVPAAIAAVPRLLEEDVKAAIAP